MRAHLIWGYALLIAGFEDSLRDFVNKKILSIGYGENWKDGIPDHIKARIIDDHPIENIDDWSIDEYLEELNFSDLNEIIIFKNNNGLYQSFFGDISKEQLSTALIELYDYRNKIAHIKKSNFSELDFISMKDIIFSICGGQESLEIRNYINNELYRNYSGEIPPAFFQEYKCINNLPSEDYDLEGGFVGRTEEIRSILKQLNKPRPHIITITGAGGVGKTAVALQVAYKLINSNNNPFKAILWFSAKVNKMTEKGIVIITPNLEDLNSLIMRMLKILDPSEYKKLRDQSSAIENYKNKVMEILEKSKCLLIIDNLETVYYDAELIDFLGDIPSPSMVLITSRKGIGEFEKRFELSSLPLKDAIRLFRLVCSDRKLDSCKNLPDDVIERLVKNVLQYPLLIKWSLGQVYRGRDLEEAFSKKIFNGQSDIAKFSFDDIYSCLSEAEKSLLFSMIVYGEKSISNQHLVYFSNFDYETVNQSIQQLLLSSLIIRTHEPDETGLVQTSYNMLSLTRSYVEAKLDENSTIKRLLESRSYKLHRDVEIDERSRSEYRQSLVSLGVETDKDRFSYQFVKAAKECIESNNNLDAVKNFENAINTSPTFVYALVEYSKFLFDTLYKKEKAIELAKQATIIAPDNFHSWWNYGVLLKKNHEIKESIKAYAKAQENNPTDSQLMIELGRVLSFDNRYFEANNWFNNALSILSDQRKNGYPFPKQEALAHSFKAENSLNWSRSFNIRGDKESYHNKIGEAINDIEKAIALDPNHKNVKIFRQIHREVAIDYAKNGLISQSTYHLQNAIIPMAIVGRTDYPENTYIEELYVDVILNYYEDESVDTDALINLIDEGIRYCKPNGKNYQILSEIERHIKNPSTNVPIVEIKNLTGTIIKYIPEKKFGIISGDKENYFFFINGFEKSINANEIENLIQKQSLVSFIPVKNKIENKPKIATRIQIV
jgi:tetratricopeptide (TPR) repeat protein